MLVIVFGWLGWLVCSSLGNWDTFRGIFVTSASIHHDEGNGVVMRDAAG